VLPSTVGFPSQSLFSGKTQDEIPGFTGGWSSGITEIGDEGFDGGIYGKGTFGKTAKAPAFTDNFTKIIKTHSLKGGFYWDTQRTCNPAVVSRMIIKACSTLRTGALHPPTT